LKGGDAWTVDASFGLYGAHADQLKLGFVLIVDVRAIEEELKNIRSLSLLGRCQ
jgi:hypothetical protein